LQSNIRANHAVHFRLIRTALPVERCANAERIRVALALLSSVPVFPESLMRRLAGSRLARLANFTVRGTLNGVPLRVPVIAGIGMMQPPIWEQEPWLNATFAKLLDSTEGAFVDVGVNLGQSLLKVKTLRPEIPYVGFEPNPVCVAYVRRLVTINRLRHVTIAPFGLSDHAGVVPLYARDDDETDSSATVVPGLYSTQDSWGKAPVAILPGDNALASLNIGRIGVIKIDVEGAELEVVRGLENTLADFRPAVVCEVLPTYSGGDGRRAFRQPRIDAFLEFMRRFEYRLFRLVPTGEVVPLDTIAPHSDRTLTNYLFVPPHALASWTGSAPSRHLSKCEAM